eukprot:TRINITY_DN22215_c0_g1_i1.p1 TRINITY_DN22215_c0_g1~~TRINITY_DN22215_c0_g1_i1.p1  ORF type:complete len:237 (+),score=39.83 TRINITY_DN22215_c0_g1_i1:43-753(+)
MGTERDNRSNVDCEDEYDDDPPLLSSQALEALKEFLNEQNQSLVTGEHNHGSEEVALIAEDWRLSQFWYDRETAETVAMEIIRNLSVFPSSSVACIACPTLYAYLKKIDPNISVQLLEFDKRFEQYGSDFMFYDYNHPEELPTVLRHAYQVVVADPPYLSEECLEKVAQTIAFLAAPGESCVLLLTGEVQKEKAAELLNLYPCGFQPRHTSKLGNEFRLFTNYDPAERLGGWERAG